MVYNYKLSIVIPIDLQRRPIDILKKLYDISLKIDDRIEIVIAHNHRRNIFDRLLDKAVSRRNDIRLVSSQFYDGMVNNSLLRNKAVEMCTNEIILLMDVDIFFDKELFLTCASIVEKKKAAFVILPCIYLTQKGSKEIKKKSPRDMFKKYLSFRRDLFLQIANPSSVMFLKKSDYKDLGGFDERFVGHGYEDFDFMIRLALYHHMIEPTDDLLIDETYRSPLLSKGFRKHLGKISLPYFFDKKVAFHLYHKKDSNEQYYQQRIKNAILFDSKITSFIKPNSSRDDSFVLFNTYAELCKKNKIDINKYGVLLDTRKGHVGRTNTLKQKIRYFFQGY